MEYASNTIEGQTIAAYAATKTENALPANYVDEKSQNCDAINASSIDLLYSPIVRGGRKMVGSCGCSSMTGGGSSSGDSGSSGGIVGGIGGYGNSTGIIGGCFSCKKGIKNITYIYSTIHIIIPQLYSKYKANRPSSPVIAKAAKATKIAKAAKAAKAANATKAPKAVKKP
jgi:hypothetical protein